MDPLRNGRAMKWRSLCNRFARDQQGTIAIIGALVLPAVVGMLAIGAEASMWRARQVRLTTVTDAIAYSSALLKKDGVSFDIIRQRAFAHAALAGFVPGEIDVDLSTDEAGKINVRLVERQQRYFSLIFGSEEIHISKRAVAEATAGSSACLVALNRTGPALSFGGNGHVRLRDCAAASNSGAANSIYRFGSASLEMECLIAVGGIQGISSGHVACQQLQTDVAPIPDPLAFVAAPKVTDFCSSSHTGGKKDGTTIYTPGRCASLDFTGNVKLEPGTYVFNSDVKINAGANITGEGVTLVFENKATLSINGNAQISLSPPKSGPLKDILLFGRDSEGLTHNGTADVALNGILYFPAGTVKVNGDASNVATCTRIVAGNIEYKGSSLFDSTCVGGGDGRTDLIVNQTAAVTD